MNRVREDEFEIETQDLQVMWRTVYGEARGDGPESQVAVAWVIINRLRKPCWWSAGAGAGLPDHSIRAVCMKPAQFSCWNSDDPNFEKVQEATLEDPDARDCLLACLMVLQGRVDDPTNGAKHYHTTRMGTPYWAGETEPCARIGGHVFYNNID